MNGSDKKFDSLKRAIAEAKAKKKNKTSTGDPIPSGPRIKSNPFVSLDDRKGNVARYGREFTAPKGSTGTSYTIPSKKKGKK